MSSAQAGTPNRHTLRFVFFTILLDSMGFGLIMPVLPRLLMRVGHLPLDAAIDAGAWMSLAMAGASFIAAPLLGNLSDALGRRTVLLVALAGMAANYLVLALAGSVGMVIFGRVLTGLFGGSYGPAQAAVADVTAPEDRAKTFGMVSAAFGVGFIAGPAVGGMLSGWGDVAPFYAALALSAANFLYGLWLFPETLKPELRRPFSLARANPFGAWKTAAASPGMRRIALVLLLWQIASLVYPLTWSFWAIAQLGWSDRMIGLSFAVVGLVIALSQVFLTGRAVKRLGERNAAQLGMLGAAAGFAGYALCGSTLVAGLLMAAIAVQSLVQPSLMAMLSRRADAAQQGEVQGLAAMIMGLGSIVGPVLLVKPMAWFTGPAAPVYFPGIAFAIAALVTIGAIALLRTTPRR
ncbi:MAG: MFS transporter, partial [Pseudomonadota bacterium]|nr:MFS transporter [Pseudomonadota bacterium]